MEWRKVSGDPRMPDRYRLRIAGVWEGLVWASRSRGRGPDNRTWRGGCKIAGQACGSVRATGPTGRARCMQLVEQILLTSIEQLRGVLLNPATRERRVLSNTVPATDITQQLREEDFWNDVAEAAESLRVVASRVETFGAPDP